MQQKRDSEEIGMAAGGFAIVAVVFFFVFAFVSLALTFLAISAWNEEKVFHGRKITPYLARCFVGYGLIGGAIGLMTAIFFQAHHMGPASDVISMPIIGYVVGSVGYAVAYLINPKIGVPPAEPSQPLPPPKAPAYRPEPAKEFEFARWNDEETTR